MFKLLGLLASAFFGIVLWSIYQANIGGHYAPFYWLQTIPAGDKVGHFVLFGVLSFLVTGALKFKTFRLGVGKYRVPIYRGACFVFLFTAIEELSQGLIPRRSLDGMDFLADCLGIVVFSFFSYVLHCIVLKTQKKQQNIPI